MVKKGGKFMSDSWNNVKAFCCKPWLVLPTVYDDALSYGEQLDKFCYSLNKLIENNNILPDYIAEKIKEYISSGAIGEVVREILANYILNVKYPPKGITPAVGDGSADDTEALQGCIDYAAENGGVVYFPYGSYLTQPLTVKDGVSLFGFDRYSTKVVLKGGATKALLNGNGNNFSVCNLTLDGNSGIQVNDVNVVNMTGSNLMFNDLIIKDGYKLFNFVGDGHLQLSNIVFGNAVENCFSVDGNVIVQTNNLLFTALSKVGGVSVVDIKANGGNYDFNSVAKCDTCMLISGNDNKVVAMIGGAAEDYVDTGEHNNVEVVGHSQKEYYSGDVKKGANNYETTLQGTRSLHVVGASTVAYDSDSTESVDGNKSSIVTGTTTETYNGRNITDTNITENSNKRVLNDTDLIINTVNPLTYKEPTVLNPRFNYIPFKHADNVYKVLTESNIQYNIANVKELGAKGDGVTDDTEAIQNAINTYSFIFIPKGTYIVNGLDVPSYKTIIGENETETILKAKTTQTHILQTLYYDAQVGKGYNSGSKNFKISNLTIDGDNKANYGIRIVGYRYEIDHCYVRNCETGISSEWCKELGEGDDGLAFESFLHELFIEKCTITGFVFNGPHDSIIENIFIRLCNNGASIINTDYSISDGTLFNFVHIYACKNTGFYTNASLIGNTIISESNGYNNDSPTASYGFAIGGNCVFNNLFAFNNKNGGVLVQANDCSIKGEVKNNTTFDISIDNKQYCVIDVISSTGIVMDTGTNNSVFVNGRTTHYSPKEMTARYDIQVPTSGKANAYKNTTGVRMLVYLSEAIDSVTIIRRDNNEVSCHNISMFILENGDSVYFPSTVPTYWTFVPLI